jgi:hypothetical protein
MWTVSRGEQYTLTDEDDVYMALSKQIIFTNYAAPCTPLSGNRVDLSSFSPRGIWTESYGLMFYYTRPIMLLHGHQYVCLLRLRTAQC